MEPPPKVAGSLAARVPRVVAVLAGLLERAAERGDAAAESAAGAARSSSEGFRGRAVPGIPVRRYAERIYRYAGCSPACFVVAYVYLDRLVARRGGPPRDAGDCDDDAEEEEEEEGGAGEGDLAEAVRIDSYTVHRLLITSVLVAAKFMDDRHNNNAYFARVGGVEVGEMNALELRLLFALRFRLNVHPDTFARYCAALECHIATVAGGTGAHLAAVPPPMEPSSPVSNDDDDDVAVTTAEDKGAAPGGGSVVIQHGRRHHRSAVVQIVMTTAQ